MNYSEQSIPLTTEELTKLRSEYRFGTILSFFVLLILLAAAVFFFIIGSDFLPFRIFAPVFALMAIGIVGVNYYRQNKDLRASSKIIVTGTIEDKRERHSTSSTSSNSHEYYFVLNGSDIAVTSLQYGQFHVHETIVIEKLPFTGKILSIRLHGNATGMDTTRHIQAEQTTATAYNLRSSAQPDFSESSFPFDESDERRLRSAKRRFIIRSFRWVSVPLWCYLAFRLFIMDGTLWQEIQHSRFTLTQFIVILPMIVNALRLPKRIQPYNLDLASGMKTIRRTVISDKRHGISNRAIFWCISFSNQEYDVPQTFYDAVEIGEEIQFHYASHSNIKFSINSSKNSSVLVDF